VAELKVGLLIISNFIPDVVHFPIVEDSRITFENEYYINNKYNRVFYDNTPGDRIKDSTSDSV
jgi:hypothetical protein